MVRVCAVLVLAALLTGCGEETDAPAELISADHTAMEASAFLSQLSEEQQLMAMALTDVLSRKSWPGETCFVFASDAIGDGWGQLPSSVMDAAAEAGWVVRPAPECALADSDGPNPAALGDDGRLFFVATPFMTESGDADIEVGILRASDLGFGYHVWARRVRGRWRIIDVDYAFVP